MALKPRGRGLGEVGSRAGLRWEGRCDGGEGDGDDRGELRLSRELRWVTCVSGDELGESSLCAAEAAMVLRAGV